LTKKKRTKVKMVSFVCDTCQDTVTKPKIKKHLNICHNTTFTCIDCHSNFDSYSVNAHTNCISEVDKYYGKFAKQQPQKKKNNNNHQKQTGTFGNNNNQNMNDNNTIFGLGNNDDVTKSNGVIIELNNDGKKKKKKKKNGENTVPTETMLDLNEPRIDDKKKKDLMNEPIEVIDVDLTTSTNDGEGNGHSATSKKRKRENDGGDGNKENKKRKKKILLLKRRMLNQSFHHQIVLQLKI